MTDKRHTPGARNAVPARSVFGVCSVTTSAALTPARNKKQRELQTQSSARALRPDAIASCGAVADTRSKAQIERVEQAVKTIGNMKQPV